MFLMKYEVKKCFQKSKYFWSVLEVVFQENVVNQKGEFLGDEY